MASSITLLISTIIITYTSALERWLNEFDYHTSFDMYNSPNKFQIYWNADEDAAQIEIGLAVPTDGYVSFGISQDGDRMVNSDIVAGWIPSDNSNSFIIKNYVGRNFGITEFTDQSGIEPIEGWKESIDGVTMTYIRFKKDMFPEQNGGIPINPDDLTNIIWAYSDGTLTSSDAPQNHGNSCVFTANINGCRGSEEMNLNPTNQERWLMQFDYHTFLGGSDDKYELYWNADQDNCVLEIGLAVETDGWVGFGISENGVQMENSDIVIGWIPSNNPDDFIVRNYQGSRSFITPFEDQSEIEKIEGWKEDINGTVMTYIRFKKEMFPEKDDGVSIKIGTTKVIWAYRDGELSSSQEPSYHTRTCIDYRDEPERIEGCRSMESINLLQGESTEIPLPEDALEWDVAMANVSVPDASTTYYCSLLELPTPDEKHQVIQIDPLIQEENIGIVHHMLLYACPESLIDPDYVGTGSVCDDMEDNMPGVMCRGGVVFFGWAIGGKSYYFPEHVGLDVGGNEWDTIKYVLLETHYDNPTNRDDIIDSSGLKLWYTPTLREFSASTLQVGMGAWMGGQFIPPGIERAVNYGYCFTECLDPGINGTDIDGDGDRVFAFANTLHTHLLGRQVILRHIRDGEELRPLDMNLAYDFDYQQMTPFEEIEILPGDELIVECVYDSTERDVMTYGGESTYDEMCLSFLMIYPKPKLSLCITSYLGYYNEETGQWEEDLARFFQEAEDNGYYNASNDFYDVEVEGALEFYQDFATGNIFTHNEEGGALRSQTCLDSQYGLLPGDGELLNVLRPDVEYASFNDEDYYVCEDPQEPDDDEGGFDWNGWYVYVVGSIIGILLIALVVYVVMRFKSSSGKRDEKYHRVLSQENKTKGYGTTEEPNNGISMQGRL